MLRQTLAFTDPKTGEILGASPDGHLYGKESLGQAVRDALDPPRDLRAEAHRRRLASPGPIVGIGLSIDW